mmetsp:Transcript_65735/g.116694  ORF Transcript_65735/g.116694 Transcript_65735/m.116694 type:complete len:679 (-) Transcript_65735:149-2185(-)
MKSSMALAFLAVASATSTAHNSPASSLAKVFEMLASLKVKIGAEGTAAEKEHEEYQAWCKETSANTEFEIKTAKAEIEELKAGIDKNAADISSAEIKISDLAASLSANTGDLKAATTVRETEVKDFTAESKELTEIIGTLERAIAILEREMAKGGAAMLQVQNAGSITKALSAMVEASVLSSADATRLTSLVQSSTAEDDSDMSASPPAAAVYEGHSGGIIETLENLLDKAQAQLTSAQKAEMNAKHNFEMLKQSLTDQVKFDTADMGESKKALAGSKEDKAKAEGELAMTSKGLKDDTAYASELSSDCALKADAYEAAVANRKEELAAVEKAEAVLKESLAGASFGQVSLLQFSETHLKSTADLVKFEAVRFVRDLARKQHSPVLAQLAARMATALRAGEANGQDPFAKVRGMIAAMIKKLEEEASGDASHKAYCDKEISDNTAKKEEAEAELSKLTSKLDSMTAAKAQLKDEVAALTQELSDLASSQAEASRIRSEEKTTFTANKEEMTLAISGVRQALAVLSEYYSKGGSREGSATGIISLLETVESDFTKSLSDMEVSESTSAQKFELLTKEAAITKATKEKDVEYKAKKITSLDQSSAEVSSDKGTVQIQLSSAMEQLDKLQEMCTTKVEPYAVRASRREAEIAGLKEALSILEGETVLLERKSKLALRRSHH